jgi:hypothetical protein
VGCFGVAGELVNFGGVSSLMRQKAGAVGAALGWAVAQDIGATGVHEHEGPGLDCMAIVAIYWSS